MRSGTGAERLASPDRGYPGRVGPTAESERRHINCISTVASQLPADGQNVI
jgi:hypothetical protein